MAALSHLATIETSEGARSAAILGCAHPHVACEGLVLFTARRAMDREPTPSLVSLHFAPITAVFGLFRAHDSRRSALLAFHLSSNPLPSPLHARKPTRFSAKQVLPPPYVNAGNVSAASAPQTFYVTSTPHARRLDQASKPWRVLFRVASPAQDFDISWVIPQVWILSKRLYVMAMKLLGRATFLATALFFHSPLHNFAGRRTLLSNCTTRGIRRDLPDPRHACHSARTPERTIRSDLHRPFKRMPAKLADKLTHFHWHGHMMLARQWSALKSNGASP